MLPDKITKILAIPYSAFIAVIFGIMILSFPIGAYLVFNSNIGNDINYQFPQDGFNIFIGGVSYKIPLTFQIGDAFIVIWTLYAILFSISFLGPQSSMIKGLSNVITEGWNSLKNNYLLNTITWFSILALSSLLIDIIQQNVGVKIEAPQFQNSLIHFFQLSVSPITEETGFRVLLIGVPLFLIFSSHASWKSLFKSLWNPASNLKITNYKKVIAIIITVGIFFGAAHIISGTPWSPGKFSQAAVAGIIIGWVYVRYGFAPAVLIHWGTNYFVYSYLYFISVLTESPLSSVLSNPFSDTLEQILIIIGILSIAIMVLNCKITKKRSTAFVQPQNKKRE